MYYNNKINKAVLLLVLSCSITRTEPWTDREKTIAGVCSVGAVGVFVWMKNVYDASCERQAYKDKITCAQQSLSAASRFNHFAQITDTMFDHSSVSEDQLKKVVILGETCDERFFNDVKRTINSLGEQHKIITTELLATKDEDRVKELDQLALRVRACKESLENFAHVMRPYSAYLAIYPSYKPLQDAVNNSGRVEYISFKSADEIHKYVEHTIIGSDYPHVSFVENASMQMNMIGENRDNLEKALQQTPLQCDRTNDSNYKNLCKRIAIAMDDALRISDLHNQSRVAVRMTKQYDIEREKQKKDEHNRILQQQAMRQANATEEQAHQARVQADAEKERVRVEKEHAENERRRLDHDKRQAQRDEKNKRYAAYQQRMNDGGKIPKPQHQVSEINGGDLTDFIGIIASLGDEDCPTKPTQQAPPPYGVS